MGPHYFFGLTWPELSAIMGVLVILVTFFVWLMHVAVTKPMQMSNQSLRRSIDQLSKQVEGLGSNAALVHRDLYHKIHDNDKRLAQQYEDIKLLLDRHGGGKKSEK